MEQHIKKDATTVRHPSYEGVFMKHFFGLTDNDRLNNVEVSVVPGFQIAPHTHPDSAEFFYVVRGRGRFLDGEKWVEIEPGDAFVAPKGMTHAIDNTGRETLVLFSTFSPATR